MTNRLKIHKDIVILKSYPPSQKATGLFVDKCEKGNPAKLSLAKELVRRAGQRRRVLLRRVSRSVAEAMERRRPGKAIGATVLTMGLHDKGTYA